MIIDRVKSTIKEYSLLQRGDRVVVALSGGPDSIALADILVRLGPEMDLQIIIGHFNHKLRGDESDEDEEFCRRIANKYGLPYHGGKMDKSKKQKGVSPESFYRRERYLFLEGVMKRQRAQKIALGHNMDDQAQTVLMRLLQGSSLEGLKGILPLRDDKFIRPLIEVARQEIVDYLKINELEYRKDSTNKSAKMPRNKIREELMPFLKKEFNPRLETILAQTAKILRRDDDFIKEFVAGAMQSENIRAASGSYCVNTDWLRGLHPALRFRLLKSLLERLMPEEKRLSYVHIEALDKVIAGEKTGKKLNLPAGMKAFREYNHLFLEKRTRDLPKRDYEYSLAEEGIFFIAEKNINVCLQKVTRSYIDYGDINKIYMDMDKLLPPLIIRNRRNGDWFEPMGSGGSKKIKDYLIDRKIPRCARDSLMLFTDSLSVVWVEKMHLSERVKITEKTKNILEVSFAPP